MSMMLGLKWGLDKMMTLAKPSVHEFDMSKEISEDSDFEHVELLLDSVDSASKRNLGGSSTLDYKSQNMAHWTAFESC
jgi:hypothetical protein